MSELKNDALEVISSANKFAEKYFGSVGRVVMVRIKYVRHRSKYIADGYYIIYHIRTTNPRRTVKISIFIQA